MRQSKLRALVLGIYALAMALMGFLHQPIAAPLSASEAIPAAYTLPDGTVLSLCQGQDKPNPTGEIPPGSDHHAKLCDACLVASGHGPASSPCALASPTFSVAVFVPRPQLIGKAGDAHTRFASRAPPAHDPLNA
jgi:hypothetical protein